MATRIKRLFLGIMSLLGTLEKFELQTDNWLEYVERIEQYFIANAIDSADKKRGILLTVIGSETYSLLRSLISPAKPADKTFTQLVDVLKSHLNPTPIVMAERFKFYNRVQFPAESLHVYLADLRKMTIYCDFGEFLNDALRDKFVCGMSNSGIRKRLFTEKDLTLEKAVKLAISMEASINENELMIASEHVNTVQSSGNMASAYVHPGSTSGKRCYRCNDNTHLANLCKYKQYVCRNCNKMGHLAKACSRPKTKFNSVEERTGSSITEFLPPINGRWYSL